MNRAFLITLLASSTLLSGSEPAQAGAFVFTNNIGLENAITHPNTYAGAGGVLTNTVCLNTSLLPGGTSAVTVENTLLKAIRSWNTMRGVSNNRNFASNNDIPSFTDLDYESALVHEIGHCVGLAHPNLASESGIGDPLANATQAQPGTNGTFDTNAGGDGNHGSADDIRGDDINRYWFEPGSNDPLALPVTVDTTTVSRNTADLPVADSWVANGDRTVLAALGYANTESVMQQGQSNAEVQRRPTNEDIRALRLGMAGTDGLANTADDYELVLAYGGQVTTNSCDINVGFSAATGFAACSTGGILIATDHVSLTSASITMSPTVDWYFSQTETTATSITSVNPSAPALGSLATVSVNVARVSTAMTGTPSGDFQVSLGDSSCSGTLSASGDGACQVTANESGSQSISAEYLGFEGFDGSSASTTVTVGNATPSVSITSDAPDPSVLGAAYNVVVSVTSGAGTPTGTVTISDGLDECTTGNLAGGSANCNLTSTTAGSKTLTATYAGDPNFNSAQDTEAHTVSTATPMVAITSDTPDPSGLGSAYTVAVTVSGVGATPTGSVVVSDGMDSCNLTLSAGSGSCDVTSTSVGAKTLTATYNGDTNYSTAQDTEAHTVSPATPTVTITGDTPDPSAVGVAYSVAVAVTSGAGTPTGTVTISDGLDECTTGNLSGGSASCDLTSTTAGSKTLTATYAGDANFDSAQDTEAHTVSTATPTVTITSDTPDPSSIGAAYTVSVSVSGLGATPTGTVTISDGLDDCTTGTLVAGAASCALTSSTAGAKTLTATYSGDSNYGSAQDTEAHTVSTGTPTVIITSDAPDPSSIGAAYTVSVTVSGVGATPTGTVVISDGLDDCTTGPLVAGAASCALTSSTAGTKTLTATYGGDSNYGTAQDTEAHTVSTATPTVTITSDTPDPSALAGAYTVAVTVSGVGAIPTGSVVVTDGDDSCNLTLTAGSGSCVITSNSAGANTLTATYGGDSNYSTAQDTEAHTVNQAIPTVIIVSDTPDPSVVGISYLATVSVSSTAGTPTGTVTISDGTNECTTDNLSSGSASCNLTSTTAGAKTLTATYSGDTNFLTAQGTASHSVSQGTPTVTITSDAPDPSEIGSAYTVAVTVGGDGISPSGSVTVDDALDNCVINLSAGAGSCQLTSTTSGSKTLTATYAGDANYNGAVDTEAHTVSLATPTVSITSDTPDPSIVGAAYTVSVSVSSSGGTPSGTVTISDGAAQCVTNALAAGAASCSLTSTTAGPKTLTASYAGDSNFNPAQGTADHLVNQATPSVAITSDTPDPSVVGQLYTVGVSVTSTAGVPSGTVTISDGANGCTTGALSSGVASCDLASDTAGAKTLTATYAGDANFTSAQVNEAHSVTVGTPTVAIISDTPDPSAIGMSYTVSVSVGGDGVAPTGTITISDGVNDCTTAALNAGAGSCGLSSNSAGTKTLTATYTGDGNYSSGQDTETHTVNLAMPTVTITSDTPDPSPLSGLYEVTVAVTGVGDVPTGTVSVSDGVNSCDITLLSGGGSCDLASDTAGLTTLTAIYSGDSNYTSGQDTEAHTVNVATTVITIDSDAPDPSALGQAYTITVSVSSAAGTPTGSVTLSDGLDQCTGALIAGTASCDLTSTTAGTKTLTATYGGDANFSPTQASTSHTVSQAIPTVIITDDAPDPSALNQNYTVTVLVSSTVGVPTGTVVISDGTDDCTTTELVAGSASCSLSSTTSGLKTLSATYSGDSNFTSAQGNEAHTVTAAPRPDPIFSDGFESP